MTWTPPPYRQVRQRYTQVTYRSPFLFEWRARDMSLQSRTGLAATFARATTKTAIDSNAQGYSVPPSQPAFQVTSGLVGLLMGSADSLYWPWRTLPVAMTGTTTFIERGTNATASEAVWYIGNAGNTGARLWIDSTGSLYRIRHDNGTTEVTATVSSGTPTAGQLVALRFALAADGSVQIWQSIAGAAETTAGASAANALASAWSDTRLYLSSTGDTNAGDNEFRSVLFEAT